MHTVTMESRSRRSHLGAAIFLAFLVGLVQFSFLFSDRPNPVLEFNPVIWILLSSLLAGLAASRLSPKSWWWLSLVACWGALSWGMVTLFLGSPTAAMLLGTSLPLGLVGGYFGSRLGSSSAVEV